MQRINIAHNHESVVSGNMIIDIKKTSKGTWEATGIAGTQYHFIFQTLDEAYRVVESHLEEKRPKSLAEKINDFKTIVKYFFGK